MKTIEVVQEADADKFVRLSIPVEEAARRYHLTVLIRQEGEGDGEEGLADWPPDFFERTAGKWVGEFVHEQQSDFEQRVTF